jgi:hypothetical protein
MNDRLTYRWKHDDLDRCLPALKFQTLQRPDKIALTINVRGSELAQAAKVIMYITADFDDVCLIFCLFAEWFAATKPEGGHNFECALDRSTWRCAAPLGSRVAPAVLLKKPPSQAWADITALSRFLATRRPPPVAAGMAVGHADSDVRSVCAGGMAGRSAGPGVRVPQRADTNCHCCDSDAHNDSESPRWLLSIAPIIIID